MPNLSQVGPYIVHGKLLNKPIYFAQRELTKEPVVLKKNNPTICEDDHPNPNLTSKRVLEHEKRIMGMLDHPNICQYLGYIGDQSAPDSPDFLILPDKGRYTLRDIPPMQQIPAVGAAIAQVSAAMVHAHERGIVHRDLKPDNLVIGREGVTIIDWGGAYRRSFSNDWGATMGILTPGTPGYMGPEQVVNPSQPGARTRPEFANDTFGLSATAYFLFTGKEAFLRCRDDIYFALPRSRDGLRHYGGFGEVIIAGLEPNPKKRPTMKQLTFEAERHFGREPRFENLEGRVNPVHPVETDTTELLEQTAIMLDRKFE